VFESVKSAFVLAALVLFSGTQIGVKSFNSCYWIVCYLVPFPWLRIYA